MSKAARNDSSELPDHGKVSAALSSRLARLDPKQKLRTIIVLETGPSNQHPTGHRPTKAERQIEIDKFRYGSSGVIQDIDTILARFDGRRLSMQPSALGTIVVERTPQGIAALSASHHVKAILQDQTLSRVL